MVQLLNFFFFITSMVVPRGTAAPVLLKWFVSRDVPTGAPSSNGTIIPIPIPEFPFLVYLHSRKFIRSIDRAKSGVLVKASRPIRVPNIIGRSSSARNALFRFVPVLHFPLILLSVALFYKPHREHLYYVAQPDLSYLESFCGLLCLQFFRTLFYLGVSRDRSSKRERRRKGQTLRPTGNEQGRNDKMRYPGHPHIERRGEGFPVACEKPAPPSPIEVIYEPPRPRGPQNNLLKPYRVRVESRGADLNLSKGLALASPLLKARVDYCFPRSPSSSGACLGGVPPEIGLEALALPTSRPNILQVMPHLSNGHDYYKKVKMNLPISHGGVCIFMLGVLLSNTNKIQFTQRLPLGPELHMGKERCCLRGLDHLHGPTSHSICGNLLLYKPSPRLVLGDRFIFEHDEERPYRYYNGMADLLPINFPASYENGKLQHFLHRWMKNHEHKNFCFTMFPEKRFFFSIRETTEVAIHTNPFTDLYAPIGTGSSRTGGWYTTIMKLPFIFSIRIGFLLASSGGSRSLLRQLKKYQLHWNRESVNK